MYMEYETMSIEQEKVLKEIVSERHRQDKK